MQATLCVSNSTEQMLMLRLALVHSCVAVDMANVHAVQQHAAGEFMQKGFKVLG